MGSPKSAEVIKARDSRLTKVNHELNEKQTEVSSRLYLNEAAGYDCNPLANCQLNHARETTRDKAATATVHKVLHTGHSNTQFEPSHHSLGVILECRAVVQATHHVKCKVTPI